MAGGDTSSADSLCVSLPDGPLRHNDRICCFALWSIKIWEVYSSRRLIHSRERPVQLWSDKQQGPVRNHPIYAPELPL